MFHVYDILACPLKKAIMCKREVVFFNVSNKENVISNWMSSAKYGRPLSKHVWDGRHMYFVTLETSEKLLRQPNLSQLCYC